MAASFSTIDDYISVLPSDVQGLLEEIRRRIHAVVPDAQETIKYQMPTVTLDGKSLVHFAGWKKHIALYPVPNADGTLARQIAPYCSEKGTMRFPLSEPIPCDLIERVVARLLQQRRDGADR